jgi:hypothetical protein
VRLQKKEYLLANLRRGPGIGLAGAAKDENETTDGGGLLAELLG